MANAALERRRAVNLSDAILAVLVISIIGVIFFTPPPPRVAISFSSAILVFVASVLFIPFIFSSQRITSVCDRRGIPLIPQRIQITQFFILSSLITIWLLQGDNGFTAVLPVWSAILGVSIYFIYTILVKRLDKIRSKS